MKPKVVYDCMVFLQGAARPAGPAAACLLLAEAGHVELLVSDEVDSEILDVLSRPKIQKKFPALTTEAVREFLDRVGRYAIRMETVPATVTLARDPKDEKYLNLAVAAQATFLVSRDKDLLELRDEHHANAADFRQQHPTIRIATPEEFLAHFRESGPNEPEDSKGDATTP